MIMALVLNNVKLDERFTSGRAGVREAEVRLLDRELANLLAGLRGYAGACGADEDLVKPPAALRR